MKIAAVDALWTENKAEAIPLSGWANPSRQIAERSVLFLLAALPLVCLPFFFTEDLFDLPKSVIQHVGLIVALVALGIRLLIIRHASLVRTRLDWPLVAFTAALIIATVNSTSVTLSIFGEYDRYDGLFTNLGYLVLFLLAVNLFIQQGQIRSALVVATTAGVIIALIGILESFGFTMFPSGNFGGRIFGTLGNPDFFGSYLTIVTPLTLGLLITAEERWSRILWGAGFVAMLYCLLLTYTRGAWIGFAVSLPVFLIARTQIWKHKKGLAVVAIFSIIALFFMQWGGAHQAIETAPKQPDAIESDDQAPPPSPLESRLRSLLETGDGTGEVRLQLWSSSVALIKDNPIFGTGLNTFQSAIMKYLKPAYTRGEGFDRDPDRAHNQYLQWGATAGLFGLGAFLAIMVAFLLTVIAALRRGLEETAKVLLVAILAAWVGFAVQNFFIFDTVDNTSIWWTLMGLGVSLSLTNAERKPRNLEVELPKWAALAGIVLLVAGGAYLGFIAVKPLVADSIFYSTEMQAHDALGNPDKLNAVITGYTSALSWYPYERYYIQTLAGAYASRSQAASNDLERRLYLDKAVEALSLAIRYNPRYSDLYLKRGQMYEAYGTDRLSEAYADYKRAVEVRPYDYNANTSLAAMASRLGDLPQAIVARKRALEVFPHDRDATYGLAVNYAMLGRLGEAEGVMDKALKIDPEDLQARSILATIYGQEGRWSDAADQYRTILDKQPENKEAQTGLQRAENKGKSPSGDTGDTSNLPAGHPR